MSAYWDDAYYQTYLKNIQRDAPGTTPLSKEEYVSRIDQNNYEGSSKAIYAQEVQNYKEQQAGQEATALNEDQLLVQEELRDVLSQEAPTFSPELAQQWAQTLGEWEQPQVQEALRMTQEQAQFANPFGRGSGSQLKASNEQIQKLINDRLGRAQQIAGTQFQTDVQRRAQALQGLAGFGQQQQNNQMGLFDRQTQLNDAATQQRNAMLIAQMQQQNQPNAGEQFLQNLAPGVGMALGSLIPGVGSAIGGAVGGMFKKSPQQFQTILPQGQGTGVNYAGATLNPTGWRR